METIYIVQTAYKYEDDFVIGFKSFKKAVEYWKKHKEKGEKIGIKSLAFINGKAIESIIPGYYFETTK